MGLTLEQLTAIDKDITDCGGLGYFELLYQEFSYSDNVSISPLWPGFGSCDIRNALVTRAGSLATIYHSPESFKPAFSAWCSQNAHRWARLAISTALDYNPISNYDRTEEWTDTIKDVASETGKNATTASGTSTLSGKADRTEKVAAFDSDNMVGRTNHGETSNNTSKDNSSTSGTATRNSTNNRNVTRKGRAYGNIGVTTTQQMIQAEREVLKYDFLETIVEEYKSRFCILVY